MSLPWSLSRVHPRALWTGEPCQQKFVSRDRPRALSRPKPGPVGFGWSMAAVPCECASWLVAVVSFLNYVRWLLTRTSSVRKYLWGSWVWVATVFVAAVPRACFGLYGHGAGALESSVSKRLVCRVAAQLSRVPVFVASCVLAVWPAGQNASQRRMQVPRAVYGTVSGSWRGRVVSGRPQVAELSRESDRDVQKVHVRLLVPFVLLLCLRGGEESGEALPGCRLRYRGRGRQGVGKNASCVEASSGHPWYSPRSLGWRQRRYFLSSGCGSQDRDVLEAVMFGFMCFTSFCVATRG